MDFSGIPLFTVMKAKLDYLSQRHGTLAQNIANADTPGYKARDVASPDFAKLMREGAAAAAGGKLPLAVTDARHIRPAASGGGGAKSVARAITDEMTPNGNNVVIEEEMAEASKNQQEYQTVLNLYGKTLAMFRTAIGKPSGG